LSKDVLNVGESKSYTLKIIYNNSDENQIIDSGKTISATIIIDEAKSTLNNLVVYGNSIQNGTPTIDAPVEIQSVGEPVNLVEDARKVFKNFAAYNELEEDGRQCIRFQSNGSANAIFDFEFKENTQYTISFEYKAKYKNPGYNLQYDVPFSVFYTDGSSKAISFSPIDNTWHKKVFVSEPGKTISHIKGITFHWVVWNYIDINTFQIEEGNVATDYKPYGIHKIPVTVSGKNLLPETKFPEKYVYNTNYGITTEYEGNGVFHIYGEYTNNTGTDVGGNAFQVNFDMPFVPTVKYTLTTKFISGSFSGSYLHPFIGAYSDTKTQSNWIRNSLAPSVKPGQIIKSTITGNYYLSDAIGMKNFWIYWYVGNGQTFKVDCRIQVWLEKGDVSTEYEPYVEPITTNIYINEPLRKIGDYVGYIDFKNSKVVRNTMRILPNSTEKNNSPHPSWWSINVDTEDFISVYLDISKSGHVPNYQALSNSFQWKLWNDIPADARDNYLWSAGASAGFLIRTSLIDGYDYSWSVSKKKIVLLDWLDSKGVDWIFPLKSENAVTENINLPNIPTHKGTNIIQVDSTIKPSNIEVEYDE